MAKKENISQKDLIEAFPNGLNAVAIKMLKEGGFTHIGGKPIDGVYGAYQRLKNAPTKGFNMDSFRGIPNPSPNSPGIPTPAQYAAINADANGGILNQGITNPAVPLTTPANFNGAIVSTADNAKAFDALEQQYNENTAYDRALNPDSPARAFGPRLTPRPGSGTATERAAEQVEINRRAKEAYANAQQIKRGQQPPDRNNYVPVDLGTDTPASQPGVPDTSGAPPVSTSDFAGIYPDIDSTYQTYRNAQNGNAATSDVPPKSQPIQYASGVPLGSSGSADYVVPGSYTARDLANPAGTAPPPAAYQQRPVASPSFMQQFLNSRPAERISDRKMFKGGF